MRRLVRVGALVLLLIVAMAIAALAWLHFRALPKTDGRLVVTGTHDAVEIVRDRWGVPHVFATNDDDAYFGLGFAAAQDRLFQLELLRHVGQGRLAELFGRDVVEVDRLFRTMDFHGIAARRLARARPEVRSAFEAYARGINAAVGRAGKPIELALLGRDCAPFRVDDFAGVLSYLAWTLQISWRFDPLSEDLVKRVGPERAAELFPRVGIAGTAVFVKDDPSPPAPRAALFDLPPPARAFLERLPRFCASNTWVVAPARSETGHALLANDPHLDVGLPSTWYHAHIETPTLDVAGATIPGLPFVVIGHNDKIAWGLTNLMLDAGDFFVERLRGEAPVEVLSRGEWVGVASRKETIRIKGEPAVTFTISQSPHGPLVSDLIPERQEALSFRWAFAAAEQTNDFDAIYALNRAGDFAAFRDAVARMGGITQNISYADSAGHIGLIASGAIPRREDGLRFRRGWDGSEEWDGFLSFDQRQFVLDPREGWLAAANNPLEVSPSSPYISSYWEPADRFLRISEYLASRPRMTLDDMRSLQLDVVVVSARELMAPLSAASAERQIVDNRMRDALALFDGWDARMDAESPAAAVFAVYYKHLFHEVFDDEMGSALAAEYRAEANLSSVMLQEVWRHADSPWFDRLDTHEVENRQAIACRAFERAVLELTERLGPDPREWRWGRLHMMELYHPLGRVRLFAPYFNIGPVSMPGHALTVFKEEGLDADFSIHMGPSLRHVVDLGDLTHAQIALPGGQSGIRASRHYSDLFEMWRAGEYHPLLTDRSDINAVAEGRLVLVLHQERKKR